MYNCTINYHHKETMENGTVTLSVHNYNVLKDGENILPEFHIYYLKNIDIDDYNTIENIALVSENYIVDSVKVTNAIGTVVQGSNQWKKILSYSCSSNGNALFPECLLRLQG